ncbi:hypothetical protein BpHYR1_035736 [Brachionus plicatilis]|uniref:Uncharacterized protein n=1 Tax=Brachionus plicatilis TaxID=10195 RepID=A0A3M7QAY7_BRAPC|nr:hypothetical protein BpHYR1_035736 [Brachionus plicatilis]
MDVGAKSAGGLGFLVMSAVAISYLAHVLEKREKMDGEAEPVRSRPKPTPDDKKFSKLAFGGGKVTPECIGEIKTSDFGTFDRESTRACERGSFADFKHEDARGRIVDEFRWRAKWLSELDEDTTSSSGFFRSGKLRDKAEPKIGTDCEPTLTRLDNKPASTRADVEQNELEVNEAKLEDEKVMTLFKLLTSGEKPDKCSKDGSDIKLYRLPLPRMQKMKTNVADEL